MRFKERSDKTEFNTHFQLGDSKGNFLFDPSITVIQKACLMLVLIALSFIPGTGALLSVELMYGKETVKTMAKGVSQLDNMLKHNPLSLLDKTFYYLSRGYNFRNAW